MRLILEFLLYASLIIHIILLAVAVFRVWRGENVVDRLVGVDLVSTLTLAMLVLIALILRDSIYIDVALGLGALGFVGILVLSKYVADEQMF
ncbi:MAG: hypothetical protein KDE48_22335 [Anaerolineales bacterium]|nr:hypothetical protein [Anaerolineales bacterium]